MQALEARRLMSASITMQPLDFVADEHDTIGLKSGVGSPTLANVFVSGLPYDPSLFTATIDWHDGTTSPGFIEYYDQGFGPHFEVEIPGTKLIGDVGTYPFTVTMSEVADPTVSATVDGQYYVEDTVVRVHGKAIVPNAGKTGIHNQQIAIFEDGFVLQSSPPYTDPLTKASNFTATINWGDGTSSQGQILAVLNQKGLYSVVASHDYPVQLFKPQTYKIAVTVKDKDGAQGTDNSYATVQAAYNLQPIYPPPAIGTGSVFSTTPLRTETTLLA